jgi:hypothetical protein
MAKLVNIFLLLAAFSIAGAFANYTTCTHIQLEHKVMTLKLMMAMPWLPHANVIARFGNV